MGKQASYNFCIETVIFFNTMIKRLTDIKRDAYWSWGPIYIKLENKNTYSDNTLQQNRTWTIPTLSSSCLYNLAISSSHFLLSASVRFPVTPIVVAGLSLVITISLSTVKASKLAFSLSNCSSTGTVSPIIRQVS